MSSSISMDEAGSNIYMGGFAHCSSAGPGTGSAQTVSKAQLAIARRLRRQADACSRLGSPLYADLLQRAAEDVEVGGPAWRVLRGHEIDPPGSALALRLMGAIHRLVLDGQAPDLAYFYPSVGGAPSEPEMWDAFSDVLNRQASTVQGLLRRPVQTNEVRRARALLGGFLQIARECGQPLSLLEVGASAGLNLRWDHFRYEVDGDTWGDHASPLCLDQGFSGRHPSFDVRVDVVQRRGCDAVPINPFTPEGRFTLVSYIWPDQVERITRLEAAIEVARLIPARVDHANALEWLEERLQENAQGVATVVYHSIVMQYLSDNDREHLRRVIREAGERATSSAPLAWLRMEPAGEYADVHLTVWPGETERLLAHSGYHGEIVHWLADQESY